jgi:transcriptional regulator with XRE-family HTH domain
MSYKPYTSKGDTMTVGELIRNWRNARGLTQQKLGERSGIHVIRISQIEGDKTNPTLTTLRRVAEALGAEVIVSFKPKDGDVDIKRWEN